MVRSMTGFGTGTARKNGWRAEVTIRTWNHRFLSVRTRSMSDRPRLQAQVEDRIKGCFHRGEVGVWLDLQPDRADATWSLFDRDAVRSACDELRALANELALPPPSLEVLSRIGALQPPEETDADVWEVVEEALEDAITRAQSSREEEGRALTADLQRLLAELAAHADCVSERLPQITEGLRAKLLERIADLEVTLDPDRLEAEVALLADRYDIQEELVRLRGHVERAGTLLESDGPIGKELDFISQELLREVNTTGSKARDSEISGTVIDMKLCVEQFREQVQNVE